MHVTPGAFAVSTENLPPLTEEDERQEKKCEMVAFKCFAILSLTFMAGSIIGAAFDASELGGVWFMRRCFINNSLYCT
jgi:hypothetical protein